MATLTSNPALSVVGSDLFVPTCVVHIYESHKQGEDKLYVEISGFVDGESQAFQPLSEETARSLGQKLYKGTSAMAKGKIPRNLLHLKWKNDKPVLTWWTPAQKVRVFYTENLKIPNGRIDVPALVWRFEQDYSDLEIYALEENKEPTDKTKLFHAPFHNVYESGGVCIGSGTKHFESASLDFTVIMDLCMRVFWGTKFSEIHNDGAINKGNLNVLHNQLVKGKAFPISLLSPTKRSLKGLYES